MCSPRTQTHRHTHRHTEWLLWAPFQGFRIFSFNLSSRIGPIHDAKSVCDTYITDLWKCIKLRIEKTGFSAFTEASTEEIFSIYDRIITGRESLNLANAVSLTRIALHGPPPATSDSAKLAENALQNYSSKYGERYCTLNWRPGVTSSTVKKVESKSWDW